MKLQYSIILMIFLFQASPLSCQTSLMSSIESILKQDSDTLKIQELQSILSEYQDGIDKETKGHIYHEMGESFAKLENYDESVSSFQNAVRIREALGFQHTPDLNESRYELSIIYLELQRKEEQEALLKDIIDEELDNLITCKAHADRGLIIANGGDFYGALQYLNSVLANSELMDEIDHELTIRFRITYVYSLKYETIFEEEKDKIDLDNFRKHQLEIESKFDQSSFDESSLYGMLNNFALVSDFFEDGLEDALKGYSASYKYFKQEKFDYWSYMTLANLGTVYSRLGDHYSAKKCYWEVIGNSGEPDLIAGGYGNMGYFWEGANSEKISFLLKALDALSSRKGRADNEFILPSFEEIYDSEYGKDYLTYLIDLAEILVQSFKESNDRLFLKQAFEALKLIDKVVSYMRYESTSEQGKLFWIEKGVDVYMLGVEVCNLLDNELDAFYFMEKNKALLLLESIRTLQEKLKLDIPKSTLVREHFLNYKRIEAHTRFLQKSDDQLIGEEFHAVNQEYDLFMDSLKMHNPEYAKTKAQVDIVSLADANKAFVSNDKVFVEYILNREEGYGLFSSEGRLELFELNNVNELNSQLSQFRTFLTEPIFNKKKTKDFKELSNSIFSQLFPFEGALEALRGKQVTVISDHTLLHVPFEALVVDTNTDLTKSYLINYAEISYLPSISVFDQIQQKDNRPAQKLLGIAPEEFEFDDLSTLVGSKESIKMLSKFSSSTILKGEDAIKGEFLSQMDDYEIIHLNTHAGIDSVSLEPWIAFRNDKMWLEELYGIENQADLVVLDACKTSDGELALGEGVFNLSRGFFYNGTQSVLASMWNVNEKSGNKIMNAFYDNLQKGDSKSKALQLAKLDYLSKHQHSEILPYYWASFTLSGSTTPVELRQNTNVWIYLGLALSGLVLFFIFWKKFYKSKL